MAQTLSSVMRIASAHRRAHSTRTAPRAPSVGGVEKGKAEDPQKPVSCGRTVQSRAPALALALVIYSCITARFASNIQPHDRVFRVGACSVKESLLIYKCVTACFVSNIQYYIYNITNETILPTCGVRAASRTARRARRRTAGRTRTCTCSSPATPRSRCVKREVEYTTA